jgi:hypothetical protein
MANPSNTLSGAACLQPSVRELPLRTLFSFFPLQSTRERFTMKILFISNDGGGFADHIDVREATSVQELFAMRVPHGRPADYLIRVNRQPCTSAQVLQEGDRVTFTPVKIEGAK